MDGIKRYPSPPRGEGGDPRSGEGEGVATLARPLRRQHSDGATPSPSPLPAGERASRKRAERRSAGTLSRPEDLVAAGLAAPERLADLARIAARYAIAVTPALADLIDPADPADPIAAQFLPDPAELDLAPDEHPDPIGDGSHAPVKGIVHRYPDRVLLKPLHACPVYCRFCFRREQVGPGGAALTAAELAAAIGYIRGNPAIWEVILSGGDPLMLSPRRLGGSVRSLDGKDHLGVIRLHSRVPVADPARITPSLVAALAAEKAVFVVIHANHPRELSPAMRAACRRLTEAGIPLLSQSVLLRGVNDDPAILEALLRGLVAMRVKPYYLHHLDRAPGTRRFRTSIAAGQTIARQLRGRVSGLCQPLYVLDLPGGRGKVPIGPTYLTPTSRGGLTVEDYKGRCRLLVEDAE
jgi:lysine 2,3-aminomutase